MRYDWADRIMAIVVLLLLGYVALIVFLAAVTPKT